MQKEDKERVVAELTERLRTSETLIVADYRGLTMPQIDALRGRADRERGAVHGRQEHAHAPRGRGRRAPTRCSRCSKARRRSRSSRPTATWSRSRRRSPTRRARRRSSRSAAASCRAARSSADDVEELAKLPPLDVLRGQVLGAIIAPLTELARRSSTPRCRTCIGLIDARIEQLEAGGDTSAPRPSPSRRPKPAAEAEPSPSPRRRPRPQSAEAAAEAEPRQRTETAAAEADPRRGGVTMAAAVDTDLRAARER